MIPKYRTVRGRLTSYALACGYTESRYIGDVRVSLLHEHGVYHVRAHDYGAGKRKFWEAFNKVGEARKCFDRPPLQ